MSYSHSTPISSSSSGGNSFISLNTPAQGDHQQQRQLDQQQQQEDDDPPLERPYHSKRPHKKSRRGCKNCKTRKVKCDEARPVCRHCRLRKETCVYPGTPPRASAPPKAASTATTTTAIPSTTPFVSPSPIPNPRQTPAWNAAKLQPEAMASGSLNTASLSPAPTSASSPFASFATTPNATQDRPPNNSDVMKDFPNSFPAEEPFPASLGPVPILTKGLTPFHTLPSGAMGNDAAMANTVASEKGLYLDNGNSAFNADFWADGSDTGSSDTENSFPLIITEPTFKLPTVDDTNMRLLWFFTTETCASFTVGRDTSHSNILGSRGSILAGDNVTYIMRTALVRHAFANPFLMNSLFALCCLHLKSLHPEQKPNPRGLVHDGTLDITIDNSRAVAYRSQSYEGYQQAIEAARPETFPALLANSLLMTALSSHAFRDPDGKKLYILDWLVVWRGIGLIIDLISFEQLFASGLAPMFNRPPVDLDASAHAIPNHLLFMITSLPADDPDAASTPAFYDALKYLGSLYDHLRHDGITAIMALRIVTWFTFLPGAFCELARARRPRALVIIAHYALFLKLVKHVWWIEGIGQRSLVDLCEHLGPEWQHGAMRIPCMALQVDDPLELARLILQNPKWVDPGATEVRRAQVDQDVRALSWVTNEGRIVHQKESGQFEVETRPFDRYPPVLRPKD